MIIHRVIYWTLFKKLYMLRHVKNNLCPYLQGDLLDSITILNMLRHVLRQLDVMKN